MVGIEEQEHKELLTLIRKLHKQQMKESIEDAEEIIREIHCCASRRDVMKVACAFFERRAPATFTVYQKFLSKKVYDIKNGNNAKEK